MITVAEATEAMKRIPPLTPEEEMQIQVAMGQTLDGRRAKVQRAFKEFVVAFLESIGLGWLL